MLFNVDKLLALCGFYKQATIETDMAKRIMLSVIPSVMSETEKFHSGGFDYKILKSAANGAKDLIKYGAKACAEEMVFYGAGFVNKYEDLANKSVRYIDEEGFKKVKELKAKVEKIEEIKEEVYNLKNEGKYKECLQKCVEGFSDLDAWEYKYGGPPWAKIADTLVKMAEKREMLDLLRQEYSTKPDPKTDYLSMEVETLREIVVLMNVFDGLAHNNGNVMPKLIHEEYKDFRKLIGRDEYSDEESGYDDEDMPKPKYSQDEEERKVKKLMDVKEINDPFVVYKALQRIIEQPENKHLFGDWVERIKRHPEFAKAKSVKEMRAQLGIITVRKTIKSKVQEVEAFLDPIYTIKDKLINTHDANKKIPLFKELQNAARALRDKLGEMTDGLENLAYQHKTMSGHIKTLKSAILNSTVKNAIQVIINRADQAKYDISGQQALYATNIDELITDISNLRRAYRIIPNLVDQYIGDEASPLPAAPKSSYDDPY